MNELEAMRNALYKSTTTAAAATTTTTMRIQVWSEFFLKKITDITQ